MRQNAFSIADRRFSNQASSTVSLVEFSCSPVKQLLESVTALFRTLDFADEFQAELGRNLWRLRCFVLFSLAPYDHKDLGLLAQAEKISAMADRLPGSTDPAGRLVTVLLQLLAQPRNPKLEWLRRAEWQTGESAAVFSLMAMRTSFGTDLFDALPDRPDVLPGIITSVDQVGKPDHSSVIVPGTCRYLSHGLFMKLFHLGQYRSLTVLLHEGESFSPKERLRLPGCALLPQSEVHGDLKIQRSNVVDLSEDGDVDEDRNMSEKLFETPHGHISDEGEGVPARFVLCDDGKGFHVAEHERIRVWRPPGSEGLIPLPPAQLLESDFVILEKGSRGELLNRSNDEFESGLDSTNVWREPLQALLLSRSLDEVATLLTRTGHIPKGAAGRNLDTSDLSRLSEEDTEVVRERRNLKSTISNWASGSVYGPGNEHYMLALIKVLADEGRLQLDKSVEGAAKSWFHDLEELRAGRRNAGMRVREEIDTLLEERLNDATSLQDEQELQLANGMVICLRRLAMIGDKVVRVPESSLNRPM